MCNSIRRIMMNSTWFIISVSVWWIPPHSIWWTISNSILWTKAYAFWRRCLTRSSEHCLTIWWTMSGCKRLTMWYWYYDNDSLELVENSWLNLESRTPVVGCTSPGGSGGGGGGYFVVWKRQLIVYLIKCSSEHFSAPFFIWFVSFLTDNLPNSCRVYGKYCHYGS